MSAAAVMAGLAAALAVAGVWEALAAMERGTLGRALARVTRPWVAARRHGRPPPPAERRRLALLAVLVALAAGWLLAGLVAGVALAAGGPLITRRLLAARRERWRRELAAGAAPAARAIADALSAGHAPRRALALAGTALTGATGDALRGIGAALDAGAPTTSQLLALRDRAADPGWDAVVAAVVLARDAGGDLAAALRAIAGRLEEDARLAGDGRAATAQARFTAQLVVALPLCALALGELAAPGTVARVLGDPRSMVLLVCAGLLQTTAALAVRRLARSAAG